MENQIKAIETEYNGYKFRSRLEARWAVFFDAAGIKYQYEPEGYELPDGSKYLPDFYLPEVGGRCKDGLFVEVKGVMTEEDYNKIRLFSVIGSKNGHSILIVGEIPPQEDEDIIENWSGAKFDEGYWNCETIDGDYYTVQFYHDNSTDKIEIWGWDNVEDKDGFSWFKDAFNAARSARFEHGEKPQTNKTVQGDKSIYRLPSMFYEMYFAFSSLTNEQFGEVFRRIIKYEIGCCKEKFCKTEDPVVQLAYTVAIIQYDVMARGGEHLFG